MNRGVLQSSPVQQMMAGNPNWWNVNNMRPPPQQPSPLLPSSSASPSSTSSSSSSSLFPPYPPPASLPLASWQDNQELPESWSQLLLGGLVGEGDRCGFNQLQAKKMENWNDQVMFPPSNAHMVDVKHETSESGYPHGHGNEEFQAVRSPWNQILPASPRSCVTSFSSNMLDFSNNKVEGRHQQHDRSSECNSTANGSAFKKAKVQPSSAQSTFKVRKEKLGDRITSLHQLVSPFGKTDTASVLLEAIGYIRFLQSQIEALSSPYLGSAASQNMRHSVQGERNCIFPEDPGQLLDDTCIKRRGTPDKAIDGEPKKDLRSRGLCLVPISCTLQVGSDNGADFWAPALGGGFR
ncbi:transcription factor bHLH68-like [Aristolochia californica]|uniref:transcription factor bHLH68-like n=1 Tax=Aristolochia californica TaxID=171875 RepID=UPI0035E1D9F4